ncbi:MAG: DUF1501 domain-containing protein [Pseudomonadota bacterium]|nr:DUF1501 domain-containing protein [Pseudomonadota bacterium]
MQRRHFLAAALPLATGSVRLLAASPGTPRVLVVFLRGAYDAASLLVPTSSSFYYEQRPHIAIARPGTAADAAIALNAEWGLHPALLDTMMPLFDKRQLAFVPFAGTDDTSRSHFETQDSIELGQPLTGPRNFQSGFMNRLGGVLGTRDAIAFTDQLPLTFRGTLAVPNLVLARLDKAAIDARQAQLIAGMYQASPLAGTVREGFAVRDEAVRDINGDPASAPASSAAMQDAAGEMQAASRNAITAKGFEGEARRVARLMRERYHLGFIDVGGWDTHVGQGAASGYLANRLAELGKGLAAYADEMGPAWNDATVLVISEFGRTFKENGNRGTDHGHGSVYWALGGAVRGGRVAGEQVAVNAATLFQNRDTPVLNEYRDVMGGLFSRLYGLSPAQVQRVFPGSTPRDLGLV